MVWDNGPWAIDGGSTSADVGRLVAWHAVNGVIGVGQSSDLRTRALTIPGGAIIVGPGTCTVPVNALGKSFQVYIGANPSDDQITIPATGATARSDLIVARVENPITGEPYATSDDPLNAQYIFTRRYPGVPAGTKDLTTVDPSASAIVLSRIDIPANTGTITQSMITDLRKMVEAPVPESASFTDTQAFTDPGSVLNAPPNGSGYRETAWTDWPTGASWNVAVPSWATIAQLYYSINPGIGANTWGELRFMFNSRAGTATGFDVNFPKTSESGSTLPFTNGGGMRASYVVGDSIAVAATERGKTVPIKIQGRTFDFAPTYVARGGSGTGRGTVGYLTITFKRGTTS